MITVRMLEPQDSSPRAWFERAIAAEVDCGVAYRNYPWALRPEYGGSVGALYRFGVECLETQRFDTDIPKQFVEAVTMVASLLDNPRQAWASPDCVRRFEVLVAGYEAAAPSADVTAFLRSGRALTAWAGGRYAAAAAAWRAAEQKLDPQWLKRLDVTAEVVAAELATVAVDER